jgi:shikimate kinase
MKIVIIGFMYSGKTSVAVILSRKLELQLIEMDDFVLKKSRRKSIPEIFEKDGESVFRQLEKDIVQELKERKKTVISTGGGVGVNKTVVSDLRSDGIIIFLHATFPTILKRMGNDVSRPLFQNKSKAEALYKTRLPLYQKHADFTIQTDNKSVLQISEEIIQVINNKL